MKRVPRAPVIVVLLLLLACSHTQIWVATGESLVALSDTFAATAQLMNAALDAKVVTPEQYQRWASFAAYFKTTYDLAADRWLHADATASEHAAVVLSTLSAELAEWNAVAVKGTAP